jgi:hypothetical protein
MFVAAFGNGLNSCKCLSGTFMATIAAFKILSTKRI